MVAVVVAVVVVVVVVVGVGVGVVVTVAVGVGVAVVVGVGVAVGVAVVVTVGVVVGVVVVVAVAVGVGVVVAVGVVMTFLNADKIYQELIDAGNDWADKDAAANALEEAKRIVLSQLALASEGGSVAARDQWALTTQTYKNHLEAMIEARRLANRAKVRYTAIQTLAELRRSQESTRRAEVLSLR